jgi:hypothetical protein
LTRPVGRENFIVLLYLFFYISGTDNGDNLTFQKLIRKMYSMLSFVLCTSHETKNF